LSQKKPTSLKPDAPKRTDGRPFNRARPRAEICWQTMPRQVEYPRGLAQALTVRAAVADRVANGKLDIPLLHDVAYQVLSATSSGDADASKMAELIHRDQALATHVLRIANSAAYLPREPILSLQQAIARLGLTTLRNIVIAVSVRARVFSFGAFEVYAKTLWRHSFATALFARETARRSHVDCEAAFMAGLLHDVGKPVVLKVIADLGEQYVDVLGPTLLRQILEEHHLDVGVRLAENWKLPKTVLHAIAFHHDWDRATESRELVMTVALADSLADSIGKDFMPDECAKPAPHDHPVLAPLRLMHADLDELLAKKRAFESMLSSTDTVNQPPKLSR
jgi:putative nucleotidyltransferase with HDIG domain